MFPHKVLEERKENSAENERYGKRVNKILEVMEENLSLSFVEMNDENHCQELKSFVGEKLQGSKEKLLKSYELGENLYTEFVRERVIERTKSIHDPIKKFSIPTFSSGENVKKKSSAKHNAERTELQLQSKLLNVYDDRPVIESNLLGQYQLSEHTAIVDPTEKEVIPNIKSGKSSAMKDFIFKLVPDSVSVQSPDCVDLSIVEGENLLNNISGNKKTIAQYVSNLLRYGVKPYFQFSKKVLLLFDDPSDTRNLDLKMTNRKRYQREYKDLPLTANFVIEDWDCIMKSPENKRALKRIIMEEIIQSGVSQDILKNGESLYLNGSMEDQRVICLDKNQDYVSMSFESFTLRNDESDFKIFFALEKYYLKGLRKFLIYSQDSDVKILSLYWTAKLENVEMIIKFGSSLASSYFHPKNVGEYFVKELSLNSTEKKVQHSIALLQCYIYFGSDATPGFHSISNSYGLRVFNEMCKERVPQQGNDFLNLILRVYQSKNSGLRRLFDEIDQNVSVEGKILKTRCILKAMKGVEKEVIPLPSCLLLQFHRSFFLSQYWTDEGHQGDPVDFGWNKLEESYEIKLNDTEDPFYSLPKTLMTNCGCTKACKKCKCQKLKLKKDGKDVAAKCARILCKKCPCFKRKKEGAAEDLILSDQFQELLDELSSDEECNYDSDLESLFDSDYSFTVSDNDEM